MIPVFGARPLKRVIQHEILNPLAKEIIAGEVKAGDAITVVADGEEIQIRANGVETQPPAGCPPSLRRPAGASLLSVRVRTTAPGPLT